MKKIIYLLIISTVIITLTGCAGAKHKEISLVALGYIENDDCLGQDIADYEFKNWYYERYGGADRTTPDNELTIEFEGEKYIGKYTESTGNSVKDRYNYSGDGVYFCINAENGRLSSLLVMHPPASSAMTDEIFEKCQQKAHEIAEKYIDTQYFEFEVMEDYYYGAGFMYRQYIDGNPTESYLMVGFNPEGKLENFAFTVPEGYKNVADSKNNAYTKSLVTALNSDESEQLAINKAKHAFSKYNITNIEIKTSELHIMPDGKLVKTYLVDITIFDEETAKKDEDGNYFSQGAMMQVVVFDE